MQKKIIELGKPSYITVETEEKMQTSEFEGTGWTAGVSMIRAGPARRS